MIIFCRLSSVVYYLFMKVEKKDLEKSQTELNVELSLDEFKPFIEKGARKLSKEIKIEGFREGKAPFNIVKQKVGEMVILEEAARIAINETIGKAIDENLKDKQPVGQPQVDITKLAPDNALGYKVVLAILPEVTVGDYKNAKVKQKKLKVEDDEVEKTIEQLREMRVKEAVVDREVQDGDKVLCDIEMFLDKVPIDGGQSKGTAVVVGQGHIVPGFGKKLIGAKKGDVREFSLPYPKDYHMANLAGKNVEFKVKVNEVYSREKAELNDDFAVSFGSKNMEDLKKMIRENIKHEKKHSLEQKAEMEMMEKILKDTKFGDIPEVLVNHEVQGMVQELEQKVTSQGGKFEDYLSSIKKSRGDLMLDLTPDALKRVKSALMVREIIQKEKIDVTEKEIDERIRELKEQYKGYEKVSERVSSPEYRAHLANIMANRKVIDKLREWNIEVEK